MHHYLADDEPDVFPAGDAVRDVGEGAEARGGPVLKVGIARALFNGYAGVFGGVVGLVVICGGALGEDGREECEEEKGEEVEAHCGCYERKWMGNEM